MAPGGAGSVAIGGVTGPADGGTAGAALGTTRDPVTWCDGTRAAAGRPPDGTAMAPTVVEAAGSGAPAAVGRALVPLVPPTLTEAVGAPGTAVPGGVTAATAAGGPPDDR